MKRISIVTPCYNEEENVEECVRQVKEIFAKLPTYRYEHIFIDNASTDRTVELLRKIAQIDQNVKIIVNSRNYGHIRSPFYGLIQATGDAAVIIAADLQDPPALIPQFIEEWEKGKKIVIGIKEKSRENPLMFALRRTYYSFVKKMSQDVDLIKNFTGFGLYDKTVVRILRRIKDPYPYFRGMISEIGFERGEVVYTQPRREHGKTKNSFYTLYDIAMLGFVNYSKIPLRMAVFAGFLVAGLSFLVACAYFVYKLLFWQRFQVGMAPIAIGLFFFSSVQLIFIGIIGEYIAAIYTHVKNRPLVIEKERVNFDDESDPETAGM